MWREALGRLERSCTAELGAWRWLGTFEQLVAEDGYLAMAGQCYVSEGGIEKVRSDDG